jgi:hypothetical protein
MIRLVAFILSLIASSPAWAFGHGYPPPAYPCTLMVFDTSDIARAHQVMTFTSAAAVSLYFGPSYVDTNVANSWFANGTGNCTNPIMKVFRFTALAGRAHLNGGNIASTLSSLSGSGQIQVTSQGQTWTSVTAALSTDITTLAANMATAINGTTNSNLPQLASFTGYTTLESCTFTAYFTYITINVTNNGTCGSNGPPLHSAFCDTGYTGINPDGATYNDVSGEGGFSMAPRFPDVTEASCYQGQVLNQFLNFTLTESYENQTTTQNLGNSANLETINTVNRPTSTLTTEPGTIWTAYWEHLTVSSWASGTIQVGQQLEDGLASTHSLSQGNICTIHDNISGATSGSGTTGSATGSAANGSTWHVNCADPLVTYGSSGSPMSMTTSPCSMEVIDETRTSGSNGYAYIEMSSNNFCPYFTTNIGAYWTDVSPGTVAAQTLMTQSTALANNGFDDTPGSYITNIGAQIAYVQSLDPNWSYFTWANSPQVWPPSATAYVGGNSLPYGIDPAMLAWSQSQAGQWPFYWGTASTPTYASGSYMSAGVPPGASLPWAH